MKYTVKFYHANPANNRSIKFGDLKDAKKAMRSTDVQSKLLFNKNVIAYSDGNGRVNNIKSING